jgi:hypothetical protein
MDDHQQLGDGGIAEKEHIGMYLGDVPYLLGCEVFVGGAEIINILHVSDDVVLKDDDVHHFCGITDRRVYALERTKKITVQIEVSVGDVFNSCPSFLHYVVSFLEVIEIDL